jgi:hypothetical protein
MRSGSAQEVRFMAHSRQRRRRSSREQRPYVLPLVRGGAHRSSVAALVLRASEDSRHSARPGRFRHRVHQSAGGETSVVEERTIPWLRSVIYNRVIHRSSASDVWWTQWTLDDVRATAFAVKCARRRRRRARSSTTGPPLERAAPVPSPRVHVRRRWKGLARPIPGLLGRRRQRRAS